MSATYKKHPAPSWAGRARRSARAGWTQTRTNRRARSDTPYQLPDRRAFSETRRAPIGSWCFLGFWILALGVSPLPAADTTVPDLPTVSSGDHSNRVHQSYIEWTGRFAHDKTNSETAWRFAKVCFQRADFSTNDAQRAAFAELGIAASQHAIALDTNSAAAYFYLGVNLGQMARTKLFTALGLLDEMETAWEKSIALDPKFHYAAAERSLGLLYLDAPGWPISLGSRSKARQHLQQATKLVPEYPENHLCWLEAQLKWGETRSVRTQLASVGTILQSARTNFTGTAWSRDWEDWDARWKRIRARSESTANARSPRDAR